MSGRRWRKVLVVASAAVATIGIGAPASASPKPKPTTATVIGPVVIDRHDPTVGYMTAIYRCYGQGTLWVSVKQVGDRSKDPALKEEGSSELAVTSGGAWSMSHRNDVDCDGRLHVQRFTVDQVETSEFGVPLLPLERGWGYAQFCLFDDNYPANPDNPEDPNSAPFSDMTFHRVL
jgi:hypothetical protein